MTENYYWVLADVDTGGHWGLYTTHAYTVPGLALGIGVQGWR